MSEHQACLLFLSFIAGYCVGVFVTAFFEWLSDRKG